jgi:alpha-L-fucosidase
MKGKVCGDFPRAFPSGPIVREHAEFAMATSDVRFTHGKDGAVYAFVMAVPKAGETLRIRALGKSAALLERPITKVGILGVEQAPEWRQQDDALEVVYPSDAALPFAIVLRVE